MRPLKHVLMRVVLLGALAAAAAWQALDRMHYRTTTEELRRKAASRLDTIIDLNERMSRERAKRLGIQESCRERRQGKRAEPCPRETARRSGGVASVD